jgi:hypothetical protein
MNRPSNLLPILVASLLLAACGGSGGSPGGTGGGGTGDGDTIEHPTGDQLVFSIESAGGFVMPDFLAAQMPSVAILGDGRVITMGAQTLQFPGPALPPLQVRRLTEDGLQAVLAEIVATNLFVNDAELRGAQNFVADAPDTVFTLHAGGREVVVTVYALGFLDPNAQAPGMTQAEIAAHQVLQRLNDRLTQLDASLPASAWADAGWQPFEPEVLRLYVRDATADPPEAGGVPQQTRDWPLPGDPAAFGEPQPFFGNGTRCGVVTDADAATWLTELQAANQLSRWSVDGDLLYAVTPRPLLPYEEPVCPELAGGA